jgi:hypothetical protein
MSDTTSSQPAAYEIRVKGHLGPRLARLFEGLEVTTGFAHDGAPVSTLSGLIADQSALHGVLVKIRDLGMQIVSVNQVDPGRGREESG